MAAVKRAREGDGYRGKEGDGAPTWNTLCGWFLNFNKKPVTPIAVGRFSEPGYLPLIRIISPLGNTFGILLNYRLLIVDQLTRSDIPLAKELQYAKLDNSPLTRA